MRPVASVTSPSHPLLGGLLRSALRPAMARLFAAQAFYTPTSFYARERASAMRAALQADTPVYLVGIGPGGHNAGAALVEVTSRDGVRLIANNEEERFTGRKHETAYPEQSVEQLKRQMETLGIRPDHIHACLGSWNYAELAATLLGMIAEELPDSAMMLRAAAFEGLNIRHVSMARLAPRRLGEQLGLGRAMPIIGMRHHDNHAWFSYAVSPFAHSVDPVIVSVLDGFGDDGAISLYVARNGRLDLVYANRSIWDSLGGFYSFLSSTQGGWTILSSEGRYMGAAAWGNLDRLSNPYYAPLRQLFQFGADGTIFLNRALANWPRKAQQQPYTPALIDILGPPVPLHAMWNPDAVLSVDRITHAEITQERLDKAAATQLVFEDALFHIVGHLIRRTGSSRLILTGGTALNGTANMRLMEHFDEAFYRRYVGGAPRYLEVWVPPTPGDAGAPMGAAYNFALAHGACPGPPLRHAFYCGTAPSGEEIRSALQYVPEIAHLYLGTLADHHDQIADFVARVTAADGIVGLFQGAAETGPRALGHRSIVANPCNPRTLDVLNRLVKFRESIRPLAPMMTLAAARRWFELAPGAAAANYDAYTYMVLTVRARPGTHATIPAVIHRDGTARIQIVRPETDAFTHAYLVALGRRLGVEVAVNTSLNVGGPIVQTPTQALETLKRSRGMDGVVLIGDEGETFLAWHDIAVPPKDAGKRLLNWLREWQAETGTVLADATAMLQRVGERA